MNRGHNIAYGVAVFIGALTVYIFTMCRADFVGDSGELTLVLMTGGIAHPPGYPLYTILGFLWLKLSFFLEPACSANLFSAVAAAGSSVVVYRIIGRIFQGGIPEIIPPALALLYAFAFPLWNVATNAEVYALSALLTAAALYAVTIFYLSGSGRSLILAGFLCGLILSHHFSGGVVIASLLVVLIARRQGLTPSVLLHAAIAFVVPLTLYLYLLIRFDPALPVNWLSERSLPALVSLMRGDIYQQFILRPTLADLTRFTMELFGIASSACGPGLIFLAFPGLIIALWKRLWVGIIFLLPALLNVLMVVAYRIPDYEGYLMPALAASTVFIGFLIDWVWRRYRPGKRVAGTVAIILIALPMLANYGRCEISAFDLADHYGRDLLDSAPKNALVFLKSDNGSHSALYLRYGQNYRSDLEVYSTNSTLTRLQHRFQAKDYGAIIESLEANTPNVYWGTEYIVNQGMNPSASEKSLRGLLYCRMGEPDNPGVTERIAGFTRNVLPGINLHDDLKAEQISLEYKLHQIDRMIRNRQNAELFPAMAELLRWGERLNDPLTCLAVAQFYLGRGVTDQSLRWVDLAKAAASTSYEKRELSVNLGIIYRQSGDLAQARQVLENALEIDPDYLPAQYNARLVQAELAVSRKDWQDALDAFDALTLLEPENPLPFYNMAVVCERLPERRIEAIDYYRLFIERAGGKHSRAVARARERITALSSDSTVNQPRTDPLID